MWWGGFSSRKRAKSAALPPAGARSPHPRSVSSEDCWSNGSSKIRAGLGLGFDWSGCDGFESRGPGAGAVLMFPGYGGAQRSSGSSRRSRRTTPERPAEKATNAGQLSTTGAGYDQHAETSSACGAAHAHERR